MPRRLVADSVPALSAALGVQLRARADALAREVRDYPTPIARCDDQLTGLLERRTRLFDAAARLEALAANGAIDDSAQALGALEACAAGLAPDDLDAAFAAQFAAALEALRAQRRARPGGCGPADVWANDGAPAA
jgi:chorismate mutase